MFAYLWKRRALVFSAILVLFLTLAIYIFQSDHHTFRLLRTIGIHSKSRKTQAVFPPLKDGCPGPNIPLSPTSYIPDHLLNDVQIVMKTGIGERSKTEAFLETYGSVIDNVLILSDAEDQIGEHKVIDILADLPESYAVNNSDWEAYRAQHEALKSGKGVDKSHGGWKLDRFKFLPMVEKAYEVAPNAEWYVFIEADIYYFWDTLFRLLDQLNPNEAHYLGSPAPGSYGRWFAYGGGGTVMSHRLVKDLLKGGQQKISEKYEQMVKDDCCGDAVLAYVLDEELGVRLEAMYPTFSGEEVQWLKTPPSKWCTPLLGLHRVGEQKIRDLWHWERCRPYTETPITYATILDFVLTPLLSENPKQGWNNAANDEMPDDSLAHESSTFCEIACADNSTCLQWRYTNGRCHLADCVMVGDVERDEKKDTISGWDLEATERLGYVPGDDPGRYCPEAEWVVPRGT